MNLKLNWRSGIPFLFTALTAAFMLTACANKDQATVPAQSSDAAAESSIDITEQSSEESTEESTMESLEAPDANQAAAMSGYYYMTPQEDNKIIPPCLTLFEDGSFSFFYDILSSYHSRGTYSVKDDVITARTRDGKKQYMFSMSEEGTLTFVQEGSSDVNLIDSELGLQVIDGAAFIKDSYPNVETLAMNKVKP